MKLRAGAASLYPWHAGAGLELPANVWLDSAFTLLARGGTRGSAEFEQKVLKPRGGGCLTWMLCKTACALRLEPAGVEGRLFRVPGEGD